MCSCYVFCTLGHRSGAGTRRLRCAARHAGAGGRVAGRMQLKLHTHQRAQGRSQPEGVKIRPTGGISYLINNHITQCACHDYPTKLQHFLLITKFL